MYANVTLNNGMASTVLVPDDENTLWGDIVFPISSDMPTLGMQGSLGAIDMNGQLSLDLGLPTLDRFPSLGSLVSVRSLGSLGDFDPSANNAPPMAAPDLKRQGSLDWPNDWPLKQPPSITKEEPINEFVMKYFSTMLRMVDGVPQPMKTKAMKKFGITKKKKADAVSDLVAYLRSIFGTDAKFQAWRNGAENAVALWKAFHAKRKAANVRVKGPYGSGGFGVTRIKALLVLDAMARHHMAPTFSVFEKAYALLQKKEEAAFAKLMKGEHVNVVLKKRKMGKRKGPPTKRLKYIPQPLPLPLPLRLKDLL